MYRCINQIPLHGSVDFSKCQHQMIQVRGIEVVTWSPALGVVLKASHGQTRFQGLSMNDSNGLV